ncbi:MAG: fibronectin type III domain-containing protein, partial [Dehalococcoidales bacterium]|nr:fibronectin type III domain-containing protein [Dehalococcoidales bacterium]
GGIVTVYYHNPAEEIVGTEKTTSTGRFSHSFLIPASTGGAHTVSAVNTEGNSAEAQFTVTSAINLNIASGGPGEVANITGSGFGFRSKITVTIDSLTITSAESGVYGSFSLSFNVPDIASGPYDIRAEDELGNIDIANFTITAGASLSQISGAVGSSLTVRGNGFLAKSPVMVDFAMLRVATETTDNNGGFTTTFSVPPVGSGVHTVTISDGTTTRQITYTIESQAPLVPAHLLPSNAGQTKVNAYLDWEDVTDDSSPVVYHLQVASDPGFSTLVVDRRELTTSEYTLGAAENLTVGKQPIAYFWRVKSQDAAWNESEWSVPWSFLISPPPAPVIVSGPPKVPALTEAEIGTVTEDGEAAIEEENKTVTLAWEDVSSISEPVTYIVQIASDPDFTDLVLEKMQLTDAGYILSEEDLLALKNNTPYYWRVKAVDNDDVESDWSESATFTIPVSGFQWPGWATFLLIGIGVVAITFIAFRVGRRTAFSQPD